MADLSQEQNSLNTRNVSDTTKAENILHAWNKNFVKSPKTEKNQGYDYMKDLIEFLDSSGIVNKVGDLQRKQLTQYKPGEITTLTTQYLNSIHQLYDENYTGLNPQHQLNALGNLLTNDFETLDEPRKQALLRGLTIVANEHGNNFITDTLNRMKDSSNDHLLITKGGKTVHQKTLDEPIFQKLLQFQDEFTVAA